MKKATVTVTGTFGDKSELQIEGYEFEVCGLPFVVHKCPPELQKGKGWSVTEPETGTSVMYGDWSKPTRASAVSAATHRLKKAGRAGIKSAIRKHEKRRTEV